MSKIVVVGSFNLDMTVKVANLPKPGETLKGGAFHQAFGGKGANQALAAARFGGDVKFIAKVGNDSFGENFVHFFEHEDIDTSCIFKDKDNPSGVAFITVNSNAENCIVVAPGANAALSVADIEKVKPEIEAAEIVLIQLEIPLDVIEYVIQIAAVKGIKVILNPAPVPTESLPASIFKSIYAITPNETEAEMLSGIKITDVNSAKKAAQVIHEKGVALVIITLGKKGALIYNNGQFELIPGIKVNAVDTTAAGDVFNGVLTAAIAEGEKIEDAILSANAAGALSVTRMGAQTSIPFRKEIKVMEQEV